MYFLFITWYLERNNIFYYKLQIEIMNEKSFFLHLKVYACQSQQHNSFRKLKLKYFNGR